MGLLPDGRDRRLERRNAPAQAPGRGSHVTLCSVPCAGRPLRGSFGQPAGQDDNRRSLVSGGNTTCPSPCHQIGGTAGRGTRSEERRVGKGGGSRVAPEE